MLQDITTSLLAMLDHAVAEGLLRPAHRDLVLADTDADLLVQRLVTFSSVQTGKRGMATGNFP